MKSHIWVYLMVILCLGACKSTPAGFIIQGHVEGLDGKEIYLLSDVNDRLVKGKRYDTLGISVVENGLFSFRGSVDSVIVAMIGIEGLRGGFPIFLENREFEAKMDFARMDGAVITGGREQDVYNLFWNIDKKLFIEGERLRSARNIKLQENLFQEAEELTRKIKDLDEEADRQESEVIRQNPNAIASAYRLHSKLIKLSLPQLEEKVALLGQKVKTSKYGREVEDWFHRLKATTPGVKAPSFEARTPDGNTISLYSIKAKYKIIEFWASWCGPCRAEMPNMVEIYKDFHAKGLEILGVSLDRKLEPWKEAIQKDGQSWLHCSDLKYWQSDIARMYVINTIPQTLVLDENNVIVARGLRGEELRTKLSELLP